MKILLDRNILLGKEILDAINKIDNFENFYQRFSNSYATGEIELQKENILDIIQRFNESPSLILPEGYAINAQQNHPQSGFTTNVEIVRSYEKEPKKREVKDFVSLFNYRYKKLKNILMKRKELDNPMSFNRIKRRTENGTVAAIGMIYEKKETKNGHIIITLEDPTDTIKVLIKKDDQEMYSIARDCVYDEVIGVTGPSRDGMIFTNKLFFPDIPLTKELKKAPDEVYAAFISDLHFGSKFFQEEEWNKFVKWIRAEKGSDEQKALAKKIKYLFIIGDIVEGVGIYPGQENDLSVQDIYQQYTLFAEFLKQMPPDLQIIICPGNHDAMRLAEPQPPLYKDFARAIYNLPNVKVVSSPSIVNIHKTENFPGFDVLLYHGYSYIYYADQVHSIRVAGGQEAVDQVMKFLLQRRHLAPSHKSTLYLPDHNSDDLLIDIIPDIFASGHIHRMGIFNYRNVQMVEASCWLHTTEYQEKMGLKPQPSRVPIINLKTRKARILKFTKD